MSRRLAGYLVACSFIISFAQTETRNRAKSEMEEGLAEYKNANYEEAIRHFRNVVHLDPDLPKARLYLATSISQQYIPGVETPENLKMATDAIEQYSEVLKREPDNTNANKATAYLYRELKKFDDARQFYRKASDIEPKDPEPYYSLAVMDWSEVYQSLAEGREKVGLKPSETLIFEPLCRDLRAKNMPVIDDGMRMLAKAVSLRTDYDDAMVYLNLLYRLRADLQCGEPGYRAYDEQQADEWANQAIATRRRKQDFVPKQPNP